MEPKIRKKSYTFLKTAIIAAVVMILLAGSVRAEEIDAMEYLYAPCYELADAVLDVIIQEDMNDYEKCCAVYDYLHKIPYVNFVYSDDWVINGYYMMYKRAGDCFGYYSASRLLLERLGYQVIKMENSNGFKHYWCLVSTDNGASWYHFDPTCWRWGSDSYLCMVTDEELQWYAWMHYWTVGVMTHDWDRTRQAELIEACRERIREESIIYLFPPEEEPSGKTGKN